MRIGARQAGDMRSTGPSGAMIYTRDRPLWAMIHATNERALSCEETS